MSDRHQGGIDTATGAPVYFSRAYDEAFDLLVEARNYVEFAVPALKRQPEPPDPISVTTETLRLTTRLTQVMAWLMAQRAVHEGEIGTVEFVEDRYRVEGQAVCLKRVIEEMDDLPDGLCDLMDRSYSLYSRILRLDEQYMRSAKTDN